jgi:5-oxoprolinase (ATP-hydrolysing)
MVKPNSFRFSIDRGGTFMDIYAEVSGEPGLKTLKLLSENTQQYLDAPLERIRQIIHEVMGKSNIPDELIEWVRLGTILATNAFLERKGTLFL